MRHFRKSVTFTALVGSLLVAGCAAVSPNVADQAVATASATSGSNESGVRHVIPSTTARPSDPPLPSDYDQDTNNQLTPQEASMNQLWALANSEVGVDADGSTFSRGAGLVDFSAAITTRCAPKLRSDQAAELDQLKAAYDSATGKPTFDAAQAYFARASELCM